MTAYSSDGGIEEVTVYFTDRDIEELDERRGGDHVTLGWLAARFQAFADLHPDFDVPVDRLATWLARAERGRGAVSAPCDSRRSG